MLVECRMPGSLKLEVDQPLFVDLLVDADFMRPLAAGGLVYLGHGHERLVQVERVLGLQPTGPRLTLLVDDVFIQLLAVRRHRQVNLQQRHSTLPTRTALVWASSAYPRQRRTNRRYAIARLFRLFRRDPFWSGSLPTVTKISPKSVHNSLN